MATQAQLTALEEAYAQGVRRVRYGDRDVEYRSLEDMAALIRQFRAELGTPVTGAGLRFIPVSYDKGTR